MFCPKCQFSETKVYDTRVTQNGRITRRRRECLKCHHRFTTIEEIKILDLMVEKRNGQTMPFSEEKLEKGIKKAFNKRRIDNNKVLSIVQKVTEDILATDKNPIKSTKIGKIVLKNLEKVDKVAYICFSAMFSNFENEDDFIKLIKPIK
ncbi:MAG: transcriptional repressor NrdR [candidate division SR1 bacterium]|nr:transcriptional repressor NrdR [candidate division SR1 bacterium]